MSCIPSTTIAALCYAKPSSLNFQALAAELEETLRKNANLDVRVSTQYGDFIILDLTGLRICLAFCDFRKEFAGMPSLQNYAESLVLAVGSGPETADSGALFERRADMCKGLVDRIEAHHPSEKLLMIELDEMFSESVYDSVLEKIWPVLQSTVEEESAQAQVVPSAPEAQRSSTVDPDDIFPEISARFDAELAKREGRKPADAQAVAQPHDKLDVFSGFWHLFGGQEAAPAPVVRPTHPCVAADKRGRRAMDANTLQSAHDQMDWVKRDKIRVALYPTLSELPDPKNAVPFVHRAAIHSMNAAVIAFSLPVGAAVLTYSILGRESLGFTSRAMALVGTLTGVSHTGFASQFINAFV
jgi:hypothetical protein